MKVCSSYVGHAGDSEGSSAGEARDGGAAARPRAQNHGGSFGSSWRTAADGGGRGPGGTVGLTAEPVVGRRQVFHREVLHVVRSLALGAHLTFPMNHLLHVLVVPLSIMQLILVIVVIAYHVPLTRSTVKEL